MTSSFPEVRSGVMTSPFTFLISSRFIRAFFTQRQLATDHFPYTSSFLIHSNTFQPPTLLEQRLHSDIHNNRISQSASTLALVSPNLSMTFHGYGNSACPLADCPKNCEHSHTTNGAPSIPEPYTGDTENKTRARPQRYNSSQSTGSTSTTGTDEAFLPSGGPSRSQSHITTPSTSPSLERHEAKAPTDIE